ncbi:twin-arginine translocation signal domain-containing protein [Haladaptatus cibarius]|uniref:twin-arginine translocation signal domain-containing protein n=1 Tax=Haladaptatus cibarius TaxID=453847 RepID=UPI0006790CB8|nr:twin-arginine translocation signal domain-containing protein [Haladaptatus cibarius]
MARDQKRSEKLNRRSFLKTAGAAVTATAGLGVASTGVSASEYETITVSAGETKNISVGSGETFENKLIDQSASGASVMIEASGSDWTIRNVGFKGGCSAKNFGSFSMIPSVSSGGKGLIENVYMGDGVETNSANEAEPGAVWVNANTPHEGELTFRHVNIQKYANNGLYASGPGAAQGAGAGGPVKVEECYCANNDIANVRLGTPGSYVKDSVIENTDSSVHHPNGPNKRGIWGWYVPITVENCDVSVTDYEAVNGGFHGGEVVVKNSQVEGPTSGSVKTQSVESNPKTKIPKKVPQSAEQAAKGN